MQDDGEGLLFYIEGEGDEDLFDSIQLVNRNTRVCILAVTLTGDRSACTVCKRDNGENCGFS